MNKSTNSNFIFAIRLIKKFGLSYFIISVVLSAFEMVIPIVNVYGLKIILDAIENKKSMNEILAFILVLFLLMGAAFLLSAWYKKYYCPIKEKKISVKMREYFYHISASIDLRYFDDTEYYNKYIKALSEAENRLFKIIDVFSGLVGTISCLVTVIVLAVSMDWLVILFSVLFLAINVIASIFGQNLSYKEDQENIIFQRRTGYVNRVFFLYQYAKELKSFSLKESLLKMLHHASDASIEVTKKYTVKQTMIALISNASNVLFILGTMAYLAYRSLNGFISIGDFAALLTASQSFNSQVESLFSIIPSIRENLLYINYLREFADNRSSIETSDSGVVLSSDDAVEVSLENVSFQYPNTDKYVLKNISGTIKKGEVLAIVGENGVGKSTLVKLLLRLYDVTDGVIKFNHTPIQDYNIKTLRRGIGIVFQDFQHYAMTVRENICFEDMDISDDSIYSALQKVGMSERIKALPNALDTVISKELDQSGAEFSGGEYQKLSLARSFLVNHAMMLFDEPSSSLDPNAEKAFFENIKELCVGRTAVIVSHRLSISKFADEIWLIHHGEVAERGSHAELMNLNGRYAAMFNNQAESYMEDKQTLPKNASV